MFSSNTPLALGALCTLLLLSACSDGSSDRNPVATTQDPPVVQILDASAEENDGSIGFVIEINRISDQPVGISYTTLEGSALAGVDFEATGGELTIPAGSRSTLLSVTLLNDDVPGDTLRFSVQLSSPVNASLGDDLATGTITDADTYLAESVFNPDWGRIGVFAEATGCSSCHRASTDGNAAIPAVMREPPTDAGVDISPMAQWAHSVMAHAFADPYFHAKLADELEIFPGLSATIEDKCLTCHAPMGRTHAHQTGVGLDTGGDCGLADGCYRLNGAIDAMHAKAGVSCTLCHQIRPDNLGAEDAFSGNYVIADELDPDAFTIFGPYLNPHPGGSNQMLDVSNYKAEFGSHIQESEFCAACHTLYTPSVDINSGVATGRTFLEQAPYLEWQLSDFAAVGETLATCQDCHQRQAEGDANTTRIAVRPNGSVNEDLPERSPFYVHELVGGNTHVLEMLSSYTDLLGLGLSTTAAGFDEKIRQTRSFLEQQTAEVSIERLERVGDQLNVDVLVMNRTGHKLPTAYPSRRVWIHLVVSDAAGNTVFESGATDSEGRLSTDASAVTPECLRVNKPTGFDSEPCFEPHRDVITSASEVALYEVVMADTNDDITHVLLHADGVLKDNRLPPAGFRAVQAEALEPQLVPVGVSGDANFNRDAAGEGSGSDLVQYRIDTSGHAGPFAVEARLLYQSIKPSFVTSMHSSAPRVVRFKAMYEEIAPPVEQLAEASASL